MILGFALKSLIHLILKLLIYLFLAMLGMCCPAGFSLVEVSRRYCLASVCRPLIAVASLVEEDRL